MTSVTVPSFYLYGEPHRVVEDGFVHAELLVDRSRPNEWTILPHAHADLAQLFLVERGGGTMHADAETFPVAAPALLIIPAGIVHGFDWDCETAGAVATMSVRHLALLGSRYPELAGVFAGPNVAQPDASAVATIRAGLDALMRELGWWAPGHGAAVDAALLSVLIETLRIVGASSRGDISAPGSHHSLVARFRARIGERFRMREPIAAYAEALGTSESRLRAACAQVAGTSPAAMLDQRAMLDAKRALRYTNLSIAEVGYATGFADPAYFSRFFTRHASLSPRAYRNSVRLTDQGGAAPVPALGGQAD